MQEDEVESLLLGHENPNGEINYEGEFMLSSMYITFSNSQLEEKEHLSIGYVYSTVQLLHYSSFSLQQKLSCCDCTFWHLPYKCFM